MTGGGRVQSLERAFVLLEALAEADRPLGVTELTGPTGLSLGTVHRLLRTLVDLGYVRQEASRGYALGPGFIRLGERASAGLGAWCRPLLAEAAQELGESVNLAALEGDHVVYVAHVPSSRSMRMFTEVGSRRPVHSTGVGKAMLADLPAAEALALAAADGMPPATEHTITDPDTLAAELRRVAERGYALDEEEQELGVRCVALAVPGPGPRLAVSVSGPTARMTDDLVARAVPLLQRTVTAISRELTGRRGETA
ncbi:helix-turn-helix domain-containing protein [Nocardioides sp. YIM 123512]|uniref:Glycerol operon regulatory protein n=1 Tax=Nocardioides flavescens TaxID=2691959 RepID=A0A6L7EUY6_9ACTN|nr:helix-turn-helix domain-containing protein [Nocardioides flavescens]